jgi:hypothetical protein
MNYQDIPQFTIKLNYRICAPLDYLEDMLERYKKNQEDIGYKFELIPDFQRGHVWTEKQQIAFVEYIFRGGDSGREIYFNHGHWTSDYKDDMVLVDGLQRITACLRFLRNEIPIFGCKRNEIEGKIGMSIYLYFNVNNLKTRTQVLTWYLEMNSGGTVHTEDDLNKVKKLLEIEKFK